MEDKQAKSHSFLLCEGGQIFTMLLRISFICAFSHKKDLAGKKGDCCAFWLLDHPANSFSSMEPFQYQFIR